MKPKFRIRSRKEFKSQSSSRKQSAGRMLFRAAAIFLSGASHSMAATVVIVNATFATNGGFMLDGGNDTITVTGTGFITPPASNDGINAGGVSNTITNSGTITTSGYYAEGIYANDNNIITNSGTIITDGIGAEGINAYNGNTITNSGTIITDGIGAEGIDAEGIDVYNGNTITNSGTITTSGNHAEGINAYNGNTITNSGTITTTGIYAEGIYAIDGNTITNSGTIITDVIGAEGIDAYNGNTITNSGTITTSGNNAEGIDANDNNTITNSGTIITSGSAAEGIYAEDGNTITNSGTITTDGISAEGIDAQSGNTITNNGTITTTGNYAEGIAAFNGNTITNSGTITTTGNYADGIDAFNGNTITNSGTIITSGYDADGIYANDNNIITHSGRVISVQGDAFDLGNNNTLNLIAPAFIAGTIDVGTDATVNIITGPSHSILWDLDGTFAGGAPNFAGSVPVFYNAATQQVATFDATGFSAQSDELADLGGSISGLIAGRTTNGVSPGTRWWMAGFAGTTSYDGNVGTLDRDSNNAGFAFGYDKQMAPGFMLGVLGGWNFSDLDNSLDRESDGFFTAVYGRAEQGAGFYDFALMGGFLGHEDTRFINDNLALGGMAAAQGSYNSWWIAPQAGIGYAFELPCEWTLTPYASLRWSYQSFDGYTETGSFANATVADRDISVLEARAQISGVKQFGIAAVSLRTGIQLRSAGDDNATVTMIGQTQSIPGFANDRTSVFHGGSVGVAISETSMLSVDAEYTTGDGMTSLRGILKYSLSF